MDAGRPDSWRAAVRPNTKAIYLEAMTNPLLEVADLRAIAAFAQGHRIHCRQHLPQPGELPADRGGIRSVLARALHSATKYLNGHSDIAGGVVAGRGSMIERIKHKLNHLGGCMDPHAVFLLNRGMKTLALRVRFQNDSALAIAKFLASHPAVARVYYPGLQTHPHHARAGELFEGFGGVLSFELKGSVERADAFCKRTTIPVIAPSLGGVETLLTRPAATSHAGLARAELARAERLPVKPSELCNRLASA